MTAPKPRDPRERNFPARCPACKRLLADGAEPHCPSKTHPHCPWMLCKCGALIGRVGAVA